MKNILKYIPNFLTSLNIFSGSLAIIMAFEGYLIYSSYLIAVAIFFDFLDGFSARMLNAYSSIGKDFDSLADLVSFGVAPSIIVYQMFKKSGISYVPNMLDSMPLNEILLLFSSLLITVFSALRLAKFNVDTRQTDSFIGLPTPANAILFASFPLILNSNYSKELTETAHLILLNPYFLLTITIIQSFLLVSELPMFSLKFKNFKFYGNRTKYFFLIISLIFLIILKFYSIPLIIIFYIILSIINNWIYQLD
ncbi:MAG: CDP-diacylglycerol--serine O-phosphatidyltransferase [Bacteroidetes bacterium 4572_128]|nr:MAG: CDP-diacylglycerol--serine O-phosphatidyltransferase [Bacteroidetes bacterium 4572_128]